MASTGRARRFQRELHLGLAHRGPREGAVVVDVEHIGASLGDEPR